MAFAFSKTVKPVVDAAHACGLEPEGMAAAVIWNTAPAVELRGCGGAPAQSASVRSLWNEKWFFFDFSCSDTGVISPGDSDGLDHYLLGDTAEVFLAPLDSDHYAEIHATPTGRKTVYFFSACRRHAPLPSSAARAQVVPAFLPGGWRVFIAVPRALVADGRSSAAYQVFFARYDRDAAGAAPVLSSFPAQHGDKPDFHRRSDYAILCLKP